MKWTTLPSMRVLGGLSLLTKKHNKQTADETSVVAEEESRSSLKRPSSVALDDQPEAEPNQTDAAGKVSPVQHEHDKDMGERTSTAASTLLMLQETDDRPTPFFQFPSVAPAVLTKPSGPGSSPGVPPPKRACFQFGQNAPSVLAAWPHGALNSGDGSPCHSPRAYRVNSGSGRASVGSTCQAELKEAVSKMVQARLSSASERIEPNSPKTSARGSRVSAA